MLLYIKRPNSALILCNMSCVFPNKCLATYLNKCAKFVFFFLKIAPVTLQSKKYFYL